MRAGQFSLKYLLQLILCAAITVWLGVQAGLVFPLPIGLHTVVVVGAFAVSLGAFSGGLIGHFGPGAVVGLLCYLPLGAMYLGEWLWP